MKSIILLFTLLFWAISNEASGQRIGVGISYATSNAVGFELLYLKDYRHLFKLGGAFQMSDMRGKEVENQLANYGQTTDGSGESFFSIDLGYGRVIKQKWIVDGELSIGSNSHYTNFIDRRFSDDGYHIITARESVVGVGVNGSYMINENFVIFTGFNTLKKLQVGLRMIL
ncbi:hypothetical protein [Dawidia soli]|uniref:Uncharacterized protein n=1 Tax=Dawidia soli TaxID=2782352 RepID=A0AAP2DCD8_9BACT|nr:hypothetical protein [Dawidia soli]MBT1689448.1 hypothetical protein [Dawidia soli]